MTPPSKDHQTSIALTQTTLPGLFFARAAIGATAPFLHERSAKYRSQQGQPWHAYSWQDIEQKVLLCANALRRRGITSGMRVAIISENRHEWVVSDLAIMLLGAISVPLFTTQTSMDYGYLLQQSGARAAIVSTAKIAYQVEPAAQASPNCLFMVVMEPGKIFSPSYNLATLTWAELLDEGAQNPTITAMDASKLGEQDIACIIYNSGSGQTPKGVMLTHKSILANLHGVEDHFASLQFFKERVLSILPLSHAYEHSVGLYYPIHMMAEIFYLPRPELLSTAMLEVKPTVMTAVPRIFDLLKDRLEAVFRQKGPLAALLFARVTRRKPTHRFHPIQLFAALERVLLFLVIIRPVQNRLGGHLKAFISGGASLSPEVSHFFNALQVRLLQGYGLTEASPVVSVTPPDDIRGGTVGLPLKGAEVKISAEGELCVKGELVMAGYWDDPAATRQVIKRGWLHTGDLAKIDDDGHITILGVKRDMIVNSGGENISPLRVELILTAQSAISQAMIFGDSRPFITAVIVPNKALISQSQTKEAGTQWLQKTIIDAIETANANLSPPERIRSFVMADEAFSQSNGLMLPQGDYNRKAITTLYRSRIDALYHPRRK